MRGVVIGTIMNAILIETKSRVLSPAQSSSNSPLLPITLMKIPRYWLRKNKVLFLDNLQDSDMMLNYKEGVTEDIDKKYRKLRLSLNRVSKEQLYIGPPSTYPLKAEH
jgi:hypothetical protein